jgi:hypothetical protein
MRNYVFTIEPSYQPAVSAAAAAVAG